MGAATDLDKGFNEAGLFCIVALIRDSFLLDLLPLLMLVSMVVVMIVSMACVNTVLLAM